MKILMSYKSLHTLILTSAFEGEGMPYDDDMVDFDGFQNLRFLSLDDSNLTGQIPLWLSKLKNLEILSLRANQITGPIPSWLGTLPRLFYVNLSENRFSGPIPTGTQLQSFNASTFEGNPKLCGAPLPNKCIPNKDMDADNKNNKDEGNGHHQLPWFYIIVVYLGFIVGFW
ncbi:unnamed protein product [Prunus armeniaca]